VLSFLGFLYSVTASMVHQFKPFMVVAFTGVGNDRQGEHCEERL
jgi:hypothetical protein